MHKWSSVVCTAFLLMLCLTGLPLIFHDEIDALTGHAPALAGPASSGTAPELQPLDRLLAQTLAAQRGQVPLFMAFDNHSPMLTVTTGPSAGAAPAEMTLHLLDRMSGAALGRDRSEGVMAFILQLHTDMFLGLPGALLLAAMGLLFVVALVSGVVLYAPFLRGARFGTVRRSHSRRTRWLDLHNLFGITALAWMTMVGATGVVNALSGPITSYWRTHELAAVVAPYRRQPPLAPAAHASLDRALSEARAALPGLAPQFVAFPGGAYSTPYHYAVFFQGATPLTERLLTVALIDARSGHLVEVRPMPWYWQALALAQPLHFGDYGGLPMKLLWAALTLFTIVVLGSGLYLWLARGAGERRLVPVRV